jgi:hypothetical protein
MLPAIIACHRNHSHFFAIWVIDLLFTPLFLVGWIAALVWPLSTRNAGAERFLGNFPAGIIDVGYNCKSARSAICI